MTNKLLVITSTKYLDVDRLIASIVLAKLVARKHELPVTLYTTHPLQGSISTLASHSSIEIVGAIDSKQSVISLGSAPENIKDVKWNVRNGELQIEIVSDKGQEVKLDKLEVKRPRPPYSRVFTLGIRSTEYLNKVIAPATVEHFKGIHVTTLDKQEPDQAYGTEQFVYSEGTTFCEVVAKYSAVNNILLTQSEATELMTGIYWRTNSLRNHYTTAATFENVKYLADKGASIPVTVQKVFSSLDEPEIDLWKEALGNLQTIGNGVVMSEVSQQTAEALDIDSYLHPVISPLAYLKDAKATFVLLPITKNVTEVVATSGSKDVNLKQLFKDYKYRGDNLQARLTFEMSITETKEAITKLTGTEATEPAKPLKQQQTPQAPSYARNEMGSLPEATLTAKEGHDNEDEPEQDEISVSPQQQTITSDPNPLKPADPKTFKEILSKKEAEDNVPDTPASPFGNPQTKDPLPPVKHTSNY